MPIGCRISGCSNQRPVRGGLVINGGVFNGSSTSWPATHRPAVPAIAFGNVRINRAVTNQTISVTNTSPDAFTETLKASVTAAPPDFSNAASEVGGRYRRRRPPTSLAE
jgi:hypothetical protein